jgi:hypothetical protein
MKHIEIKCEFVNVRPREITIQIGAPLNRMDATVAFGQTKKNQWLMSVTWGGLLAEASCQQLDDDYGQYIYALLMRRVVRVFEACGIELPVVAAGPEEVDDAAT